jgi:uncharacterized protein YkwD
VKKLVGFSVLMVLFGTSIGGVSASADAATTAARDSARRAPTSYSPGDFESRLLARTNTRRARHGCRPLRQNAALALAARLHSLRMAAQSELSHRLADEPGLEGRAVSAGYTNWRLLAENLAWGQSTPDAVFREWVHSAGHRANLDNCRLRDVGVSVVIQGGQPWVTQDFGRRHR